MHVAFFKAICCLEVHNTHLKLASPIWGSSELIDLKIDVSIFITFISFHIDFKRYLPNVTMSIAATIAICVTYGLLCLYVNISLSK